MRFTFILFIAFMIAVAGYARQWARGRRVGGERSASACLGRGDIILGDCGVVAVAAQFEMALVAEIRPLLALSGPRGGVELRVRAISPLLCRLG
jgi:hypothetical protein